MAYRNSKLDFYCRTGLLQNRPKQELLATLGRFDLVISGAASSVPVPGHTRSPVLQKWTPGTWTPQPHQPGDGWGQRQEKLKEPVSMLSWCATHPLLRPKHVQSAGMAQFSASATEETHNERIRVCKSYPQLSYPLCHVGQGSGPDDLGLHLL